MNNTLVSIIMITYGHEEFIRNAIEGVLMQKVNFEYELIISNDKSPDLTGYIISDIIQNHPKAKYIKYIEQRENLGMIKNFLFTLGTVKSKYIALCEGDDFWTDPNKLQKQVDFMIHNIDYAICFTKYRVLFNDEKKLVESNISRLNNYYTVIDLIENNPFATSTAFFESKFIKYLPQFFQDLPFGDLSLYLQVLLVSKKKAYLLEDDTSVYRIHKGGVHGKAHLSNLEMINAFRQRIEFWDLIKKNNYLYEFRSNIDIKIINDKKILAYHLQLERSFLVFFLLKIEILFLKIKSFSIVNK